MVGISSLFLCLAVLTFGSVSDAAVFSPWVRNSTAGVEGSLIIGKIGVGDRLLWTTKASKNGEYHLVQTENVVFRGNSFTRITMLRARELGSQGAHATLIDGGLHQNFAAIMLRSAVSRGYTYSIDFWGR